MPRVQVLRPFANGHHDDIVHPGDIITVSEDRRRDLGDLVGEPAATVKAAPAPDNKMFPVPANKARMGRPPKGTR